MGQEQGKDASLGRLTWDYLSQSPYMIYVKGVVLSYVIVGAIAVVALAQVYPIAAVVVGVILVVIAIAVFLLYLNLRRRILHYLMARRADKQNAAYLKGKDKGIHGKFRPEDIN